MIMHDHFEMIWAGDNSPALLLKSYEYFDRLGVKVEFLGTEYDADNIVHRFRSEMFISSELLGSLFDEYEDLFDIR